MIWYSVDIRCDEFLITFMKSRDAKLPNNTNLEASASILMAERFAKHGSFSSEFNRWQCWAKVVLVDCGEHRNWHSKNLLHCRRIVGYFSLKTTYGVCRRSLKIDESVSKFHNIKPHSVILHSAILLILVRL